MIYIDLFLCLILYSQVTYSWPIRPTGTKLINSTFGEYRPQYNTINPHFHEGIDIPPGGAGSRVYSITYRYYVDDISFSGGEYIIRLIQVYDDGSAYLHEGSRYVHLITINSDLEEGKEYTWDDSIGYWLAYANDLDHLHLELREPFNLVNSVNPFSISELRINDYNSPILHSVYVDYSLYGSAEVENWNFLKILFANFNNNKLIF